VLLRRLRLTNRQHLISNQIGVKFSTSTKYRDFLLQWFIDTKTNCRLLQLHSPLENPHHQVVNHTVLPSAPGFPSIPQTSSSFPDNGLSKPPWSMISTRQGRMNLRGAQYLGVLPSVSVAYLKEQSFSQYTRFEGDFRERGMVSRHPSASCRNCCSNTHDWPFGDQPCSRCQRESHQAPRYPFSSGGLKFD
jgi:hypothetical protein